MSLILKLYQTVKKFLLFFFILKNIVIYVFIKKDFYSSYDTSAETSGVDIFTTSSIVKFNAINDVSNCFSTVSSFDASRDT